MCIYVYIQIYRKNPPLSSGPGIFLYKMPCLNLQNGLPGNFSTKCLALDRLLHYKMSAEKGLKLGWI